MVGISADGARARPRLAIERFWNLPNTVTLARIGAGPLLLLLLASPGPAASRAAGIAFLALSLTDLLDGYLARRAGEVTRIGKLLDPLADKLLVAVALMTLIALGRIPLWAVPLATVILLREIAVTSLRAMASAEGVIVAASQLAKWKTGFQIAALTALLLHYPFLGLPAHGLGLALLVIATGLTLWSGYDYFATYLGRRPGPEV
jgi:CDP-diacylglycerol--glycerol-3-phosphate 3-phosphatidyltransferase